MLVLGVFADERQAVAPDVRRRPLRAQRPAQREPLRRRRRSSSTSASPSSRPTARWSTTCTSTSRRRSSSSTRNLKGRVLTGYVDRISINQVIADARDAGAEPDITRPVPARPERDLRPLRAAHRAACRIRRSAARRPTLAAMDRAARHRAQLPPRVRPPRRAGQVALAEGRHAQVHRGRSRGDRAAQMKRGLRQGRHVRLLGRAIDSLDRKGAMRRVDRRLDRPLQRALGRQAEAAASGNRHGPRLKRSWTANASKSISPRPMGAASCFPGAMTAPPAGRSAVI